MTSAAVALATALVVIAPAQAGVAAVRPLPVPVRAVVAAAQAVPRQALQRTVAPAAPVDPVLLGSPEEGDAFGGDDGAGGVPIVDGTDAADDDDGVLVLAGADAADGEDDADVPVVDGTDAVEDDSDALADESGTSTSTGTGTGASGGAAPVGRRDRTSGRWARVALPSAVRATLTGSSRAKVTWRAAPGRVPARRYAVELRAGASVLRTTTSSKARSATLWGLAAGERYIVTVAAIGSDGTRRAAAGTSLRTPPLGAPKRGSTGAKPAPTAAKRVQVVGPR